MVCESDLINMHEYCSDVAEPVFNLKLPNCELHGFILSAITQLVPSFTFLPQSVSLTFNTSHPVMTSCLQHTLLTWIPLSLLWIPLPVYLNYLWRIPARKSHFSWSILHVTKMVNEMSLCSAV